MKTKLIFAIVAVVLCAATLVGVTAAQFVGAQNQPFTVTSQTGPRCIDSVTDEPYCINNGTCTNANCNTTCTETCNETCTTSSYCWNTSKTGNCQNGNCNQYEYSNAAQTQNQYQNGCGMNQRNSGNGRGCSL
jgi:hypothetical protein